MHAQAPSEADVVVVGAGPAGSATAIELAERGHRVVLLDRAIFPRPKPCAEYVSPGAVALLERLRVLPLIGGHTGRWLRGMELRAPGGASHLVQYRVDGEPRRSLAISRLDLDAALVAQARARSVAVWEGFRATDLLRDGGAVRGVVGVDRVGRQTSVRARLVVGADGMHSLLVQRLGLRRRVGWPRRLGLVAHLRGVPWPEEEDYGHMYVGHRGYVGVAPLDRDLVSVGLVMPLPAAGESLGRPEEALRGALGDYPELAGRLANARPATPVQGVGPLAHAVHACAGDGYLLVGDAAGFVDPFTGEGIYRALRGAQVAADYAHAFLEGRLNAATLATEYARARRRVFAPKERLTRLIQLFVHVPALLDYAVARLRRRPRLAAQLADVLGDRLPAQTVFRAGYVWGLLRP